MTACSWWSWEMIILDGNSGGDRCAAMACVLSDRPVEAVGLAEHSQVVGPADPLAGVRRQVSRTIGIGHPETSTAASTSDHGSTNR